MLLVDSHTHIDAAEFDPDRDAVLARARAFWKVKVRRRSRGTLPSGWSTPPSLAIQCSLLGRRSRSKFSMRSASSNVREAR